MIVFIIIVITLGMILAISSIESKSKIEAREFENSKELEKRHANWKIIYNSIILENGDPTKIISITPISEVQEKPSLILVFENKNLLWINGTYIPFDQLIGCSLYDNSNKDNFPLTTTTKTDIGDMIGRAVVGGVICGEMGSIIGASTAKKESQTVYNNSSTNTQHDYTVIINVNSISNPTIELLIGDKQRIAIDIIGLLNVIISRNKGVNNY